MTNIDRSQNEAGSGGNPSDVKNPSPYFTMHVLVPGDWSVQRGHDLCEKIEAAVRETLPQTTVFTHLEPREDPVSWDDRKLDRD